MNRIRLPLAASAIFLLAACHSPAPTAPADPRTPTTTALFASDSTSVVGRGGTMIGSDNSVSTGADRGGSLAGSGNSVSTGADRGGSGIGSGNSVSPGADRGGTGIGSGN